MRTLNFLILILLLPSCHQKAIIKNVDSEKTVNIAAIKNYFKLDSVRLLGSMDKDNKRIVIVYGDRSLPTYKDQGLFLYPIGPVPHIDSLKSFIFSLPGNEYNMLDSLVYQSRVFYGNCTTKFPFSVIWHQKEKLENGSWRTGYYVVNLERQDYFSLQLTEGDININEILDNIKQGKCKELSRLTIHLDP
jgi:hypothetical protein